VTDSGSGETIEITGTLVRLYRPSADGVLAINRQVALRDFLSELEISAPRRHLEQIPLLPPGARWLIVRGPSLVVAVEHPPQVRRVRWSEKAFDEPGTYRQASLAFPYVIYLLLFHNGSFEEMRLFYRTAPLVSDDDALSMPNLWNISASESPLARCRVCLRGHPEFDDLTVTGQARTAIEFFWGAGFNLDIESNCFRRATGLDGRIASLEAWERASEADPLFPLAVAWEPAGLSLRRAGEHLLDWRGLTRPIQNTSDLADLLYRLHHVP
jgi:hypothetical protein